MLVDEGRDTGRTVMGKTLSVVESVSSLTKAKIIF